MKILVVRRDNIGDLVLTTPVLAALRARFPGARIEVLANSYNGDVLRGHPDVDRVHTYTKTKHHESLARAVAEWTGRVGQGFELRRERYDFVLLASPGFHPRLLRFARWWNPRHVVAFCPPGRVPRIVDHPVAQRGPDGLHHVESTFRILEPLGIAAPMPALRLGFERQAPRARGGPLVVGVHLSARRERNRWPEARFVALLRALHASSGVGMRLFWAPGAHDDRRHPGDDDKARRVLRELDGLPVEGLQTRTVAALAQGLAECDALICSDGGAMHLAAALGKPIVCFFGDSLAAHWHPWGVPYRLLQPPSLLAADIPMEQALEAFADLAAQTGLAAAA